MTAFPIPFPVLRGPSLVENKAFTKNNYPSFLQIFLFLSARACVAKNNENFLRNEKRGRKYSYNFDWMRWIQASRCCRKLPSFHGEIFKRVRLWSDTKKKLKASKKEAVIQNRHYLLPLKSEVKKFFWRSSYFFPGSNVFRRCKCSQFRIEFGHSIPGQFLSRPTPSSSSSFDTTSCTGGPQNNGS